MALILTRRDFRMKLTGAETVNVSAGKDLVIETSPAGEEILRATVPVGKTWEVKLIVDIIETDAT